MIGTRRRRRRRAGRRSRRWRGRRLMVHWCVMLLLTGTNYYSASVLLQDMSPGSMQTHVAVVERSKLLNEACTETHRSWTPVDAALLLLPSRGTNSYSTERHCHPPRIPFLVGFRSDRSRPLKASLFAGCALQSVGLCLNM